jgi:hypothetical protein
MHVNDLKNTGFSFFDLKLVHQDNENIFKKIICFSDFKICFDENGTLKLGIT